MSEHIRQTKGIYRDGVRVATLRFAPEVARRCTITLEWRDNSRNRRRWQYGLRNLWNELGLPYAVPDLDRVWIPPGETRLSFAFALVCRKLGIKSTICQGKAESDRLGWNISFSVQARQREIDLFLRLFPYVAVNYSEQIVYENRGRIGPVVRSPSSHGSTGRGEYHGEQERWIALLQWMEKECSDGGDPANPDYVI